MYILKQLEKGDASAIFGRSFLIWDEAQTWELLARWAKTAKTTLCTEVFRWNLVLISERGSGFYKYLIWGYRVQPHPSNLLDEILLCYIFVRGVLQFLSRICLIFCPLKLNLHLWNIPRILMRLIWKSLLVGVQLVLRLCHPKLIPRFLGKIVLNIFDETELIFYVVDFSAKTTGFSTNFQSVIAGKERGNNLGLSWFFQWLVVSKCTGSFKTIVNFSMVSDKNHLTWNTLFTTLASCQWAVDNRRVVRLSESRVIPEARKNEKSFEKTKKIQNPARIFVQIDFWI